MYLVVLVAMTITFFLGESVDKYKDLITEVNFDL